MKVLIADAPYEQPAFLGMLLSSPSDHMFEKKIEKELRKTVAVLQEDNEDEE